MNLKKTLEILGERNIIVEIFGLGYIGFPLAIKLGEAGFNIIGIDNDENKIKRFKKNQLVYSELNLKNEFRNINVKKQITFSIDSDISKKNKISIICVPTPLHSKFKNSSFFLKKAIESILRNAQNGDVIIIESSIEIGTTEWVEAQINSKGFVLGENYGLAFCPERIDPLNKNWTIHNIPRVIYCSDDITFQIAKKIFKFINKGNLIRVSSSKVAEVTKAFENAYRLTNISLVNELALLCESLEIDVGEVIKAASTKPFGFKLFYTSAGAGGHCIPKDPLFLLNSAKKIGFNFRSIDSAIKINKMIPKHIVNSIDKILTLKNLKKSVIVCGLSYKQDMDDMRDSSGFKILKEFNKKKFLASGYDPFFNKNSYYYYLKENQLEGKNFIMIDRLDDKIISNYNCLCVVQHHKKIEAKIIEIYKKSIFPLIYDCQNKIKIIPTSKTLLKSFGNKS